MRALPVPLLIANILMRKVILMGDVLKGQNPPDGQCPN